MSSQIIERQMTDEELNALVKRLDDMSDLSRDHAAGLLDLGHKVAVNQAITAITTLRAQLAEAQHGRNVAEACNRGLVRLNEATQARADRAEAALAAQIEADAGIALEQTGGILFDGVCISDIIRNQPHDRTALDAVKRAAKVEAWKEVADFIEAAPIGTRQQDRDAILALIEREGV